jgi:phenylalanyl-tRNA synthetase beta chain
LALVIDKEVRFSRLKELAFRTEKQLLRKVSLFDIYEGKGIPEGKKSYAISFVLRDDNKTLNDRQIEKAMERLLTVFTKELGAALRG